MPTDRIRTTGSFGDSFNSSITISDRLNSAPSELQTATIQSGTIQSATIQAIPLESRMARSYNINSLDLERLDNYLEEYIKNRNEENPLFVNHNTCQREIRYNSIDDIIELRARLDEIIKEHYQR